MRTRLHHLLALTVTALVVGSCAAPPSEKPLLHPLLDPGQVWPEPPEEARIQLIAEFTNPADLGIRPSLWGRISTITTGPASNAMVRPMAVAVSPDGQVVYVADPGARCVHRYNLQSSRYHCLVADSDGILASPIGLAIAQDGKLYATDSQMNSVFTVDRNDDKLRPLTLTPPPVQPTGVAIGPLGDLYVTSTGSHSVRRYATDGRLKREYGRRGSDPSQMNYPTYLWLTPEALLVSDTMNFRIQRIDPENGILGIFGKAGDGTGSFSRPKGVAVDQYGHIYVVDGMHHAVQIFDSNGGLLLAVGEQGHGHGEFWLPNGIFITNDNLIFIADTYNSRVQIFRYIGEES